MQAKVKRARKAKNPVHGYPVPVRGNPVAVRFPNSTGRNEIRGDRSREEATLILTLFKPPAKKKKEKPENKRYSMMTGSELLRKKKNRAAIVRLRETEPAASTRI